MTSSGTSTSTFRAPDLQSPTPTPQPIVNLVISMKNVQLSLFSINNQLTNTLSFLKNAIASAVGVAPPFVSIRRIRDMTFPLTPSLVWTNPLFAGDAFPDRRRLQGGPLSGSVSIDIQIRVLTTVTASKLSATLLSSTTKLETDISQSLINQGLPISTAQFSVTVEPFTNARESVTFDSPTSKSTFPLEIAAPVFTVVGAFLATVIFTGCYIFKRRFSSKIAPEEEFVARHHTSSGLVSNDEQLRFPSKSSHNKSRNEDPNFTVARIGADFDTSSANVGERIDALKAQQEASLQERIAQREVLKARVARKKAEEYKELLEQREQATLTSK